MNARQKAKKLKKELDFIKSQPFREFYGVVNVPTEHFKATYLTPVTEIEKLGEECIENEARIFLSNEIKKVIKDKLIVHKDRDLDRFHCMRYSTDIFIAFGRGNK